MSILKQLQSDLGRVELALDRLADRNLEMTFWWRDDGANEPSRALDRLLTIQDRTNLPLNLAVIPNFMDPAIANAVAGNHAIDVWQLGASHVNYAGPDVPKNEFPEKRNWAEIAYDITEARYRLEQAFGTQLAPVLVPPWGNMAIAHTYGLAELGFAALSTQAPASILNIAALPDMPVHFSVMRMQAYPRFGGRRNLSAQLTTMIDNQLQLASLNLPREAIGLKTQHADHDDATWDFTYELLMLLKAHPAAVFTKTPWNLPQRAQRHSSSRLRLIAQTAASAPTLHQVA